MQSRVGLMDLWGDFGGFFLGIGVLVVGLTLAIRLDGSTALRRFALRRAAARAADGLPFPVWSRRPGSTAGQAPVWANDAFRRLSDEERRRALEDDRRPIIVIDGNGGRYSRQIIGEIGFALPCEEAGRADGNLRDLLQTMTQTFAQLPLGVAVFDDTRHLASFNPVLAELAGLSPAFLSRRPSLTAMLDAMRDRSRVPEPANWKDWRAGLATMERTGSKGVFEDIWALPGGQTYKVTGRLHRGGGLALMIEDVSSEILQGRRYRANLDLCQGVIDRMEEAIAVFAASGQLVLSNQAHATLWNHDPGEQVHRADLRQVAVHWRKASAPTSLWTELEAFGDLTEDRRAWQGEARLNDGRLIRCRCEPLTEGAMLVAFRVVPAEGPQRSMLAGSA